ncbi:MAG: GNAT family N-acetyltransferase [Phycisphaerales bacterium]|nr:GNAT family N-acetyltransferase [Phycisphaerales bacterium]
MVIRPVVESDFPAIAALTNRYITGSAVHFAYQPVTAEGLRNAWLETRATFPYVVAEIADLASPGGARFAGYAKAARWRERDAYRPTAEVGIYVEPGVQGQGIGKALHKTLIQACREAGFHSLIAGIAQPNEASVALHLAVGFDEIGVFRQVGWKLGRWHDVGFYQMMLKDAEDRPVKLLEVTVPAPGVRV